MRNAATASAAMAVLALTVCKPQAVPEWASGSSYDAILNPPTDSAGRVMAPGFVDTMLVRLHVDSVSRDSVFGAYLVTVGDEQQLVRPSSGGTRRFAGVVRGDSCSIDLEPSVNDGRLRLRVTRTVTGYEGEWIRAWLVPVTGRVRAVRIA